MAGQGSGGGRPDDAERKIATAEEPHRMLTCPEGREVTLHDDVVVRATRRIS